MESRVATGVENARQTRQVTTHLTRYFLAGSARVAHHPTHDRSIQCFIFLGFQIANTDFLKLGHRSPFGFSLK